VIRYALRCAEHHSFEAWFRGSADYDEQKARGLLSCPVCGLHDVDKALMAPAVRTAEAREAATVSATAPDGADVALLGEREQKLRGMLRHIRQEVTKNATDVGPRFAEVARQMHEGEIEKGSVYGRATSEDVQALADDGIEFHPLPALADEAN
jgi:hypothetical protein